MLIPTIDWATSTTETKSFLREGSFSQQVNKHAGSRDPAFFTWSLVVLNNQI